jgi:hypothetical protein
MHSRIDQLKARLAAAEHPNGVRPGALIEMALRDELRQLEEAQMPAQLDEDDSEPLAYA